MLNLEPYVDRKPKALSGGQRQRVAMGRAIVREPSVFLMDEPLSNLDAKLRVETRANISALQSRLGTTTVYVTHDQVEAMTMGHRVAVLKDGVLQQVDTPRVLYERPANAFVAGFIGSPSMNLNPADIEEGGARIGGTFVPLARDVLSCVPRCWAQPHHTRHQARIPGSVGERRPGRRRDARRGAGGGCLRSRDHRRPGAEDGRALRRSQSPQHRRNGQSSGRITQRPTPSTRTRASGSADAIRRPRRSSGVEPQFADGARRAGRARARAARRSRTWPRRTTGRRR